MQEFANLARIVTSRGLSPVPLLHLEENAESKEAQFVAAVLSVPNATQTQVAKSVYGGITQNNMRALQKLQSRVRAKMLNHLYFLDHSDERFLVSRRYQMECLDLLHKVSILFAEGEYVLTEQLLKKCVRQAAVGEFTQYTVQCARMLCTMYAELRKATQFKKMDEVLLKAQRLLDIEDKAERISTSAQLALASTVKSRREILPQMPELLKRLETLHRQAGTFNTYNYLYRLRIALHELNGEYSEIIRLTALADKQLQAGSLNARRFDKRYNSFMRVFSCLRTRRYSLGLTLARTAIKDFHPSSGNWFYFQEYHLLLALHSQEYEYAQTLLTQVKDNAAYTKQRPAAVERWDLYRAYMEFVNPQARVGAVRRLQMAQWAQTLPEFTQDKAGLNIAIVILQMLHYMRNRNDEAVMIRLERLRKYQQRHMEGSGMVRSRLFLRLLRLMVDCGFDARTSTEKGRNLLNVLQNTPPPGEAAAEVEIIPYEHLWGIILKLLRENRPESDSYRLAAAPQKSPA